MIVELECQECMGCGLTDEYCTMCNGSGEGMADGAKCCRCKGSGTEKETCTECGGSGYIEEDDNDDNNTGLTGVGYVL